MGRASHLTAWELGQIQAYLNAGKTVSEVSRLTGRSRKAIANARSRGFDFAPNVGGRKKVLVSRHIRRIARYLCINTVTSLRQVRNNLNLKCGLDTIHRVLRCKDFASYLKFDKKPRLSAKHKSCRLHWAMKNCSTDWATVVFSDEKRFCLANDSYLRYWHCKSEKSRRIIERSQGQLSNGLMVWLGVSYNGLLPLKIFRKGEKVNSKAYQDCLKECLLPYMTEDLIFQQDNCPVHVSKSSLQYLSENNIKILDWPSCSPDLNIVENIWSSMSKQMYEGGKCYANLEQLEDAIKKAYENIKDDLIIGLYNSLPKRLMLVAEKKGGTIDY